MWILTHVFFAETFQPMNAAVTFQIGLNDSTRAIRGKFTFAGTWESFREIRTIYNGHNFGTVFNFHMHVYSFRTIPFYTYHIKFQVNISKDDWEKTENRVDGRLKDRRSERQTTDRLTERRRGNTFSPPVSLAGTYKLILNITCIFKTWYWSPLLRWTSKAHAFLMAGLFFQ